MSATTEEPAATPVVVIYGDFNCPFSAAASARADRVEAAGIAEVDWHGVEHAPEIPTGGQPVTGDLADELDREIDRILEQLTPAETGLLHRPTRQVNTNAATVHSRARRRSAAGSCDVRSSPRTGNTMPASPMATPSPTSEPAGSTPNSQPHGGDHGCHCLIRSCPPWCCPTGTSPEASERSPASAVHSRATRTGSAPDEQPGLASPCPRRAAAQRRPPRDRRPNLAPRRVPRRRRDRRLVPGGGPER